MTYNSTRPYPRDLIGYDRHAPQAQWSWQMSFQSAFKGILA